MASVPAAMPTFAPIVHDYGYSNLSQSDRGGVIGAVAAFGTVIFCFIVYLLFRHKDDSLNPLGEQASVAQAENGTEQAPLAQGDHAVAASNAV